MKRKMLCVMLCVMLCLCGCTKEIQYTTKYVTNCETAEFREEPSNGGTVLYVLEQGAIVSHEADVENGYAKVVHNGVTGYVLSAYLAADKPETETPAETVPPVQEAVKTESENLLPGMNGAARREVNLFLSNFSEAYYNPNGGYYGEEEAKISFAYIHAGINLEGVNFYDDGYMGISADKVDEILIRFFGSSVPHRTPENGKYWFYEDGKFMMPAASGESYADFSIATGMRARTDGNFDVSFNIYADPTVTGGDIISDKSVYSLSDAEAAAKYDFRGSGTAVLKAKTHNGSDTYELVSYSPVYSY